VVALTALSGKQDRERCVQAGMDDFLAKPIRAADVYPTLERVMLAHPDPSADQPEFINPAVVLSACGGDETMLAEMIQLFQEEAPELLAEAEAALRSSEAEQLRKAAHALRGLVSAFSTRVARMARTLEQMAAEGHTGEAGEQYQSLSQAVEDLRTALATLTIEKLRVQAENAG
jgi:HPt (histidine-containing phosphotransfer) domain-containing protein